MAENWTDITIVSKDKIEFKAHRLILATISPSLKEEVRKATEMAGKKPVVLHMPFCGSAIVLLLSYSHANGMLGTSDTIQASCPNGQADSLRATRRPMRDILSCAKGYTLAHHYGIEAMLQQLWPHIMRLAEQHMRLHDYLPLMRAIVAIHDALPSQQYLATPLVDLLAVEFERLWKEPAVARFAQRHASFGWQMSVRLHAVWASRVDQLKASEEK